MIYSLHAKFAKGENWNLVLRGSNFFHEIKCLENHILHQDHYEEVATDDYHCTEYKVFSN